MTLIPIPMCDQNLFRPFPSRELDDDACLSVRAASGPLACFAYAFMLHVMCLRNVQVMCVGGVRLSIRFFSRLDSTPIFLCPANPQTASMPAPRPARGTAHLASRSSQSANPRIGTNALIKLGASASHRFHPCNLHFDSCFCIVNAEFCAAVIFLAFSER